jgi:hypothetical protein
MRKRIDRYREYLETSKAHEIARRLFVMNAFDRGAVKIMETLDKRPVTSDIQIIMAGIVTILLVGLLSQ